jgi:quercetin 2,3-dioxygenase
MPGRFQHSAETSLQNSKKSRTKDLSSKDGRDASVTLHQYVDVWAARCVPEEHATHRLKPSRHAFVQVARGAAKLNGGMLNAGDGAAISQEEILEFKAVEDAGMLLFDLA